MPDTPIGAIWIGYAGRRVLYNTQAPQLALDTLATA